MSNGEDGSEARGGIAGPSRCVKVARFGLACRVGFLQNRGMEEKASILIVDDEKNTREGLSRALGRTFQVHLAESAERALEILSENPVDVVLSDVRMPGMDGLTLMKRVLARTPQPAFILLTAYGSIEDAVEATKLGAYDFLTKPVNLKHLNHKLDQALRSLGLERENKNLHEQLDAKFGMENIIGRSAAMTAVFDTIRQVSSSRATVLIEGESGTGKELAAQAIHRLSPRMQGPFVPIHCASLNENLLESELFGHERGAFTGATERRLGRFEQADGGTLFLDEIGEIGSAVQVKLLRVLEERRFERVGGTETIDVDVRLIAATNRDLKSMVDDGEFREDLFYRLYVVALRMPPLRERRSDIALLLQEFLALFNTENGKAVEGFTPDALDLLSAYGWNGNVRELRNVVERMVVMAKGNRLTVRDLPLAVREGTGRGVQAKWGGELSLEEAERAMIVKALKATGGNRTMAAGQLGISRRTLHRKLNEYGLRDGS
jgi:two-component system response regulator AtoC